MLGIDYYDIVIRDLFITSNVICSVVSIGFALYFILYVIFRTLKSKKDEITNEKKKTRSSLYKRAIRLLFFLQINSIANSLIFLSSLFFPLFKDIAWICICNGMLGQIFAWIRNTTTCTISLWILFEFILIKNQYLVVEKKKIIIEILSYLFIVILSLFGGILPAFFGQYVPRKHWCFLRDLSWTLGSYYIPQWVLITITLVAYLFSLFILCSVFQDRFLHLFLVDPKREYPHFISKLLIYPLIFIIIGFFSLVRRVVEFAYEDVWLLAIFHLIIVDLYGFYITVTFFLSTKLEIYMVNCFMWVYNTCCCFCPKSKGFENEEERSPLLYINRDKEVIENTNESGGEEKEDIVKDVIDNSNESGSEEKVDIEKEVIENPNEVEIENTKVNSKEQDITVL